MLMKHLRDTRLLVYPHEGLTGYWYVGWPDYEELKFLEKFLRAEDVFYDVGANAGAYSVFAAGLGCRVVSFEPVPATFARLKENAELNDTGKFSLRRCAVGSSKGSLKMTVHQGPGNHVLQSDEVADFVEVEVTTLDRELLDLPGPTFIKADIEGFELEMLRGATQVLRSDRLLGLLIETFRPHNWHLANLQALELLLRDHGFLPYRYDVESNGIVELKRPQDGDNNTLYFRSPERVAARIAGFGK
jgi:FkbM family methyltransferase